MTPQRRRLALTAALLLPLAALASSWAIIHRQAQQGQDWLVPIQGYDPRDLLRGHYVQYRYDWPTPPKEEGVEYPDLASAEALCVVGVAPHIRVVHPFPDAPGRPDLQAEAGCAIVLRAKPGTRREVQGLDRGIFYASQVQAIALSKQLADPALQGLVRVRVRPDGIMRPVALEFRRRPSPPKPR